MQQKAGIISQFFKYSVVGGIAAVVDISIFSIGVDVFRLNHILTNTFSLTAGLVINYLLSSKWVFNIQSHHTANFLLFAVIGLIGFALSNLLLLVMIDMRVLYLLTASTDSNVIKPLAKVIATGIVLFWNFAARRRLVLV